MKTLWHVLGRTFVSISVFVIYLLVAQSCLTPCDPMDCSSPGSSVHGILQARILERVAIPFSRGSSDPGIEPRSPVMHTDSLPSEPPGKPRTRVTEPKHKYNANTLWKTPPAPGALMTHKAPTFTSPAQLSPFLPHTPHVVGVGWVGEGSPTIPHRLPPLLEVSKEADVRAQLLSS